MTKEEHFEGLKNDIIQIMEFRTSSRFMRAFGQLATMAELESKNKRKPKPAPKHPDDGFYKVMGKLRTRIKKEEFKVYFGEIDRYEKKHKEDMLITYGKARDGDDNSLWKLIKWDKSWLFIDWVRSKILEKENEDDRLFFSRLSDAIKKNTRFNLQSKGKKSIANKKLLNLIRETTTGYPLKYENEHELWKDIYQTLYKCGLLNSDEEILPPSEQDYFMKWAKRHGLKQ